MSDMTTATPETPVERRLREMAHCPYCTDGYAAENLPCIICDGRRPSADTHAIDAGREAIALLRDLLDNYECGDTVDRMIGEFLARCGGQEGAE